MGSGILTSEKIYGSLIKCLCRICALEFNFYTRDNTFNSVLCPICRTYHVRIEINEYHDPAPSLMQVDDL